MEIRLEQTDLFPSVKTPEGTLAINDRCLLRYQDDHCLVLVSGHVVAQYAVDDQMAAAYAMVSLVDQGWADQNDVARAFGCSARTLRRHQRRFEDGGLPALGRARGYPKGRGRLKESRRKLVHRLKAKGHSNREIARRIGVTEVAVRKTLRRLGWKEPQRPLKQAVFPFAEVTDADPKLSAFSSPKRPRAAEARVVDADQNCPLFNPASRSRCRRRWIAIRPIASWIDSLRIWVFSMMPRLCFKGNGGRTASRRLPVARASKLDLKDTGGFLAVEARAGSTKETEPPKGTRAYRPLVCNRHRDRLVVDVYPIVA